MATQAADITLYTGQTPNGIKISILLEELGVPYKVVKVDMRTKQQKSPWYLAINPNGRIPAITDSHPSKAGETIRVFESGAVMQYLVTRYDTDYRFSFPVGSAEWAEMTSWLHFQMGGLGPMQGQANHFNRYAEEKHPYSIERYVNETKRLYGVLEAHLSATGKPFLAGDKYTIADMISWGWVSAAGWAGVDIDEFPHVKRWNDGIWARPAVKRGANVPEPYRVKDLVADPKLAGQYAKSARETVLAGMKDDREANAQRTSAAAVGSKIA